MQLQGIQIRTVLKPGDIGNLTYLHGVNYHQEYNYGLSFESYVALGLHEFYQHFNAELDCIWIAEKGSEIIGYLAH